MSSITLKNIYKRYKNGVTAVSNFNLNIKDKEFIVLVGPSGCGKSTTLRMIAGLEEITEGELYIGDRLVNNVAPKNRDIAMVFQNYALYPHMNVYNNMAFALKLRGFKKSEIKRRIHNAAKILGLEDLLDRKPRELSGGQRQRVALGRAIVREPQAFLMDEPLSNLDAKLRVQMRAELKKLHLRLQTTMVYVTHDQTEAMTMADRIVIIKDGKIQQIGTPKEVYDQPKNKFVAGFIGSPAMNFINGIMDNGTFVSGQHRLAIPKEKIGTLRNYNGKRVILGIRPEDVHVVREDIGYQPDSTIETTIDVVEMMGAETIVYSNFNGHDFVARLDSRSEVIEGYKMRFILDMNKIHFFDGKTEERIN